MRSYGSSIPAFGEIPDIGKRAHRDYTQELESGKLNTVFLAISRQDVLPHGTMTILNRTSGVPVETLGDYRKHLLKDLNWRPNPNRTCGCAVSPDDEKSCCLRIRQFVDVEQNYCPVRAHYARCLITGEAPHFGMIEAIAVLVDVWKGIEDENVRNAWNALAAASDECE